MHYHEELQAFDNISDSLSTFLMLHKEQFKNIMRRLITGNFLDRENIFRHNIYGTQRVVNFILWFRQKLNTAPSKLCRQTLLGIVADQLEHDAADLFNILEDPLI